MIQAISINATKPDYAATSPVFLDGTNCKVKGALAPGLLKSQTKKNQSRIFRLVLYDNCCESCHRDRLASLAIVMFVLGFDVGFVFASDEVDDQLGDRNKRDDQHN